MLLFRILWYEIKINFGLKLWNWKLTNSTSLLCTKKMRGIKGGVAILLQIRKIQGYILQTGPCHVISSILK